MSAAEAYALVSKASPFRAAELICARACDGIIVAKAQTLIWGAERRSDIEIPDAFWWARGHAALTQNWETGDFETWINQRVHCRAYGVTFLNSDIRAMVPANGAASAGQDAKTPGAMTDDFLSAAEASRHVEKALGLSRDRAADLIKRYCAADLLRSRCEKISVTIKNRYGSVEDEGDATELDHQIWENISFAWGGVEDWAGGRFVGRILDDGEERKVRLRGVRFSASDIADLIAAEEPAESIAAEEPKATAANVVTGGRPPAVFWDALWAEICRALYLGDLKPERQADIERAMLAFVEERGFDAGVSTIRPRARKLWRAISQEDGN